MPWMSRIHPMHYCSAVRRRCRSHHQQLGDAGCADGPQRQMPHRRLRARLECPKPSARPKHKGPITRAFLEVLQALLWGFHNARSGICFPGYEAIAERAGCARSTVAEALKVLEWAGGRVELAASHHQSPRTLHRSVRPHQLALAADPHIECLRVP
jgi:Helix-turn-helix domain